MQILISWSRAPSKRQFRSFVKILFWVENLLLWRGIRDGQNSCGTCHNTKGWKHIRVLRKQAGNKLLTVHSSVLTLYFDFDFGGSDNGEDALKIALGKNVRSVQLASKSTNLRPGTQKTFGRKNTAFENPPVARPSGAVRGWRQWYAPAERWSSAVGLRSCSRSGLHFGVPLWSPARGKDPSCNFVWSPPPGLGLGSPSRGRDPSCVV